MASTNRNKPVPVVLVTGGSSGIGLNTARLFAASGCTVYEFSRHEVQDSGAVRHMSVDVTQEEQVSQAVSQILEQEGQIDIVVNCAGYGISGAVEFTSLEQAKSQFEVNFFGMVNVNRAVLTSMREWRSGRIINISSVAATAAIPFQTFYSASKAAINSYTCALANEIRPFGVSVTAIQPGDIRTGFTAARAKSLDGDREYDGRISKSVSRMEHDEQNGMSPKRVARKIHAVAFKKSVKPLYSVGFSYQLICVLCQILPHRFSNWVIGILYG